MGASRASCKALRNFVDINMTNITLSPTPQLRGPAPLERWPVATEVDLNLDAWELPEQEADVEQAVAGSGAPAAVEAGSSGRPERDLALALALGFDGAPLAARQRIARLRVLCGDPCVAGFEGITPAIVAPLAALFPSLRVLHLIVHVPRSNDDTSPLQLQSMYASLARGMPHLEDLMVPDAAWLDGVDALAGLKRLAVTSPAYEHDAGSLTPEGLAAACRLPVLESLELNDVGGLPSDGARLDTLPLLGLLRSLPASLQRLHIPCYLYFPSWYDLSLSATFGPSPGPGGGDTNASIHGGAATSQDGAGGAAKTTLQELHFDGPIEVLAHVAEQLFMAGRLPPRVSRLHIGWLQVGSQPLDPETTEMALGRLLQRCDCIEVQKLHVKPGAWGGALAPELRAAVQAVQLLGVPRKVVLRISGHHHPLEVDTGELALVLPRRERDAMTRVPDPEAFLRARVQDLVDEHRGALLEDSTTPFDDSILLLQGSYVDALPDDPLGLQMRLDELQAWLQALLPQQKPGARLLCEACLLPPASCLLLRLRAGVRPAVVAVVLAAVARAGGLDLEVVRVGRNVGWTATVVLHASVKRGLQSALDDAARLLPAVPCLEWLYGIGHALQALPICVENF
ncbi:hypothetical protein HYH03_001781 [Edaphochlamys debaryana]|uniref:Uncharacterized protein n=1 Tax=Edaphochlamys debaryana TaxID=47281 RepID=A0A836C4I6_9CHLO|nr:hypothetical protein HYH03_001781 [Edaphochlamys debaryana]|eukprot:KAG2500201.1 hypothetical protein HYH03_001781 [Edaphochlamys debaryana]